jgi:hypothetical protein
MRNPLVRSVRVSMPTLSGDSQPSVCSSASAVLTSIWFEDYLGSRPPLYVSWNDTSNTRLFPSGDTTLSLSGSTPTLQLVTQYTLTCPQCSAGPSSCLGLIYFQFQDSLSVGIDISDPSPLASIQTAIESLADLINLDTSMGYDISSSTSSSTLCSSTSSSSFEISLLSAYGNLPKFTLIDSTLVTRTIDVPLNLTLTSNHGMGTLTECSNQGLCNHTTGLCRCLEKFSGGVIDYQAISSDGSGSLGSRGDCGYLSIQTDVCTSVSSDSTINSCSGHGFCAVVSEPCLCYDGWYGYNCQYASCPTSRAWFDEAISTTEAHLPETECSAMGHCDRLTGLCHCREGYSGAACQYLDCPYDTSTGASCSSNGWCLSMADYITQTSSGLYQYGTDTSTDLSHTSSTERASYPDTWDAQMIHYCLCSSPSTMSDPSTSDTSSPGYPLYPPVSSNGILSGIPVETRPLSGYTSYACQSHRCPSGPKVTSGRLVTGNLEVQRVLCIGTSTSATTFSLIYRDLWTSLTLTGGMTSDEIKEALEWIPALGNVTIEFQNSDVDGVTTACAPSLNLTYGGFYVTFLEDLGDVPTLTTTDSGVTIETFTEGTIVCLTTSLDFSCSLVSAFFFCSFFWHHRRLQSVVVILVAIVIASQVPFHLLPRNLVSSSKGNVVVIPLLPLLMERLVQGEEVIAATSTHILRSKWKIEGWSLFSWNVINLIVLLLLSRLHFIPHLITGLFSLRLSCATSQFIIK